MALWTAVSHYGPGVWSICSRTSQSLLKYSKEIPSTKSYLSSLTLTSLSLNKSDYQHHNMKNIGQNCSRIPSSSYLPSTSSLSPFTVPVRHYQSILRPRLHCKGCYFVWRHGRKFVECSDVPSHKQMKKLPTRKVWLEDYSRGDVNVAMKWNRDVARIADRHVDKTVMSHNWLASRIGKDV